MDWNHELVASLLWLLRTFIASLFGLGLTLWALSRYTVWGRQFRRISWDYFHPRHRRRPLLSLMLIIFMTLFGVRLNVVLSFWSNHFFNAMQQLDAQAFWFMMGVFSILATIHVGRSLLTFYLQQAFAIRWRAWLTRRLLDQWLAQQAYYRSQFVPGSADNPDQRIQQDIEIFVSRSMSLAMGMLEAVVSLLAFTLILWNLSGALALLGLEIPRAMVFMVYLYVLVATVFALKIGRPLIALNFLNEKLSANFRYALMRLREYGESIAFYRGEGVERDNLLRRFAGVIGNAWDIVFRSLKFQGFNLAVSQTSVVFPFLVQAPRLFSKQISFGDMMQTAEAFSQVGDALSFFRSSYESFAGYRAVVERLAGFAASIEASEQLPAVGIAPRQHGFALNALTVRRPDQSVLVDTLSLELSAGTALLIRGPSGIGKTTLLRAVAGLWPYQAGQVARPVGSASLFLPQKPYLPLGSLRQCLYYPQMPPLSAPEDAGLADVLHQCQLDHLRHRLDDEADWGNMLSLGEQQRLAIARVLLNRPGVVFLDEASSAMDEGLEHAMYHLLRETLPQSIIISVGHRSSLLAFHTHELELQGEGRWRLADLGDGPQRPA